jgi:hypothetical protein
MSTKIFVNLPVADLPRSRAFFGKLGYGFNAQFSNDAGACMVISDDIYCMLLTKPFFQGFTRKPIGDAHQATEVLVCLSAESRDEVNRLVDAAMAAGATEAHDSQDHGFMFGRSFHDLDGHIWEIMWMDPTHVLPAEA